VITLDAKSMAPNSGSDMYCDLRPLDMSCCFVLVPPIGLLPSMLFRGLVAITVLNRSRYNVAATYRIMIIQSQIVVLCGRRHVTGWGFWCSNHPVIFLTHVVNWLWSGLKCMFSACLGMILEVYCLLAHHHICMLHKKYILMYHLILTLELFILCFYFCCFSYLFIGINRNFIRFLRRKYIFLYKYLRSSVKIFKMHCL